MLAANTYSKSALRAAVEGFVVANPGVDYCPSYEIVTLSSRTAAFHEDNRHVAPELVGMIVDQVLQAYAPPDGTAEQPAPMEARAARSRAGRAVAAGAWSDAANLLTSLDEDGRWKDAGYDEFEFRLLYGRALSRMGRPVSAEVQFARAVQLAPESPIATFNLALARQKLRRNEEAEQLFRRTVELDPDQPDYQLRLARQLIANGRHGAAEPLLTGLARAGVEAEGLQLMLQEVREHLLSEGFGEAAVTAAAELPRLPGESNSDALHRQARIDFRAGRYLAAAKGYAAALEDPGSADVWRLELDCGISLLRAGKTEQGVVMLAKAIDLRPGDARAHHKLGLGLARLRRNQEACEQFRLAAALEPTGADYHWRLGVELRILGQPEEAERSLRACLAIDPGHKHALAALDQLQSEATTARS